MASGSSTHWWKSTWFGRPSNEPISMEEENVLHRKRLASILRYIASMHQDAGSFSCHHFVRQIYDDESAPKDFFQDGTTNDDENGILFSSNDFRKLISIEAIDNKLAGDKRPPPFSFYAPKQSMPNAGNPSIGGSDIKNPSLYGLSSVFHSNKLRSAQNVNERGLWLRLTRLGPSSVMKEPQYDNPVLRSYLNSWLKESSGARSIEDLLTLRNLDRSPGILSTTSMRSHRHIKNFLQRYKTYLRTKMYQKRLEPIYNSLFEWNQQQNENNEEIVWGLGHAKMTMADGRLINGPILEILVEIELAPDGALLIRPREHTGVTLNREVVSALVNVGTDPSSLNLVLAQLHKAVGNMETSAISPGQPRTYVPFLKRVAVELSSGGTFRASSDITSPSASKRGSKATITAYPKLEVTEAWCLYSRSKPSSVWARDANLLADRVGNYEEFLPPATWSLTHGPSKLEEVVQQEVFVREHGLFPSPKKGIISAWLSQGIFPDRKLQVGDDEEKKGQPEKTFSSKPIFPLATSESQNRIADLLLRKRYPAVIAEGPPGTGKTHTIANIVSAYLCEGKRVLVTSKNANALSVLRNRLPLSIRELVVDVSMSESQGMRQLQQTVERLAVRVSVASTDIESEKRCLLQRSIDDLDAKLQEIDEKIMTESERVRQILQQPDGLRMIETANDLIKSAPWLLRTLPKMSLKDIKFLACELEMLELNLDDPVLSVTGFDSPPSSSLISLASAKSGSSLSSISQATKSALASLPIFGPAMDCHMKELQEKVDKLHLNGSSIPESTNDWKTVTKALKHALAVNTFELKVWRVYVEEEKWPQIAFRDQKLLKEINALLQKGLELKKLHVLLHAETIMQTVADCRKLNSVRTRLSNQKHHHSEELADAAVVAELSRSFSPDAQSALIKFAQIAGAAKFSRSAKPSKMSQRQRRRRQEYLSAFDRCCRFIPCWILTTSQISDYLPAECLFDLVVIDESSQSDVAVLPGMMRGKQWLIVGDGKQVSPTEAFVSEENIENLRATLPEGPLEDALLPGRSFFDMCAQAFPKGRVVLTEHFRCAPEIIDFSNEQFYDGRLIPLRLPTKNERFTPSILDIRVTGGTKSGKVNEKEADKIVAMIKGMMMESAENKSKPRSIGIISLIGDEQSRLIRGRLLDSCGPEYLARHDVLIGDPPQFQGAERDVVFLSMVCSKENCPTQSQQFHFQRANVALSRARDRIVLVRSVDLRDIPSLDDVKIPIIEFFMHAQQHSNSEGGVSNGIESTNNPSHGKQYFGKEMLSSLLKDRGYQIADMSMIWKNAFCVEDQASDTRVAILVDCEEPQKSDWLHSYSQQKAIERVGWKCMRVDALSIAVNYATVFNDVIQFLNKHGIEEPSILNDDAHGDREKEDSIEEGSKSHESLKPRNEVIEIDDKDDSIGSISEEEGRLLGNNGIDEAVPDQTKSCLGFSQDESDEAWKFGEVVDLDFLRVQTGDPDEIDEDEDLEDDSFALETRKTDRGQDESTLKRPPEDDFSHVKENEDFELDQYYSSVGEARKVDAQSDAGSSIARFRKRRKTANYSRDERWDANDEMTDHDKGNDNFDWTEIDADIPIEKLDDDGSWDGDGVQLEGKSRRKAGS